jgi:hypothetical protein
MDQVEIGTEIAETGVEKETDRQRKGEIQAEIAETGTETGVFGIEQGAEIEIDRQFGLLNVVKMLMMNILNWSCSGPCYARNLTPSRRMPTVYSFSLTEIGMVSVKGICMFDRVIRPSLPSSSMCEMKPTVLAQFRRR